MLNNKQRGKNTMLMTIDKPSCRGDKTYSTKEYEYMMAKSMCDPTYAEKIKHISIDFANSKRKSTDLVRIMEIMHMISRGQKPIEELH